MHDLPQPSPPGALAIVATPIGNLRDITLRALDVLRAADLIAAEDTRTSQHLLAAYGIRARLLALHQHNEAAAAGHVIEALRLGQRVAYVSDAGTPGVSDPGAGLVRAVRAAGLPVLPIPGASALTAALSVSGLDGPVLFHGFLPVKSAARRAVLQTLAALPTALVFYEAPHRIDATVADLLAMLGGARPILFARELSKRFEQLHLCPLAQAAAWLAADEHHRRGEFVLVLAPPASAECPDDAQTRRILQVLMAELPLRQAAHLTARISGAGRNAVYDIALRLKEDRPA